MTTIARVTQNRKSLSLKGKSNDQQDTLKEIREVNQSLLVNIDENRSKLEVLTSEATKWKARAARATEKKDKALTPEAANAMSILVGQAERYTDFYNQSAENTRNHIQDLTDHQHKIQEAVLTLTAVEDTNALDEALRKMASEENIVIESSRQKFDMRDIELMTHTAKALIELKTGKV